jgi:hypothetical protein
VIAHVMLDILEAYASMNVQMGILTLAMGMVCAMMVQLEMAHAHAMQAMLDLIVQLNALAVQDMDLATTPAVEMANAYAKLDTMGINVHQSVLVVHQMPVLDMEHAMMDGWAVVNVHVKVDTLMLLAHLNVQAVIRRRVRIMVHVLMGRLEVDCAHVLHLTSEMIVLRNVLEELQTHVQRMVTASMVRVAMGLVIANLGILVHLVLQSVPEVWAIFVRTLALVMMVLTELGHARVMLDIIHCPANMDARLVQLGTYAMGMEHAMME